MRKGSLNVSVPLLLTLVLLWGPSWAGSMEDPLKKGTIEWGIVTGYGLSNSLRASKSGIDLFTFMPRVGYVFAELQGKPPFRGSVEVIGEAVPVLLAFESRTIYSGGLTALLAYHPATGTRVVPFLEGGAGVLLSTPRSRDPASQFHASQFNFTLQIGAGIRYFVGERAALSLEYRFHHISDAGLTERNPGLNSDFVLIGFSISR